MDVDIEHFEADRDNVRIAYSATDKASEEFRKKIAPYICFFVGKSSNRLLEVYPY